MSSKAVILRSLGMGFALMFLGQPYFCFSAEHKLKPLDIETIHLYVEPSAIAKADSAFSTKHFKRGAEPGRFERKISINVFKNRPVFQYARGYVRVNQGKKLRVDWRYRGLLDWHWQHPFPYKSMKIRFLEKSDNLDFSVVNLNQIDTDPKLKDMISHEFYNLYGCITPRMKLVRFYVNDQYAGFKVLVENLDDQFLKNRSLPKGNIYRENTSAMPGAKVLSGVNYYRYWWKKKSLRNQDDWADWVHFNQLLAQGHQEVGEFLLDRDYYLSWLALGFWIPIYHMDSHNLYIYHNLSNQKWYPIPWDMTIGFLSPADKEVFLLAPNKIHTSVLLNPYNYHKRNRLAWELLQNDNFFAKFEKIIQKIYADYENELVYCRENLKDFDKSHFSSLDLEGVILSQEELSKLIDIRRQRIQSYFRDPPEVEVAAQGKTITVKGTSLVGFKIRGNGWLLRKQENLTMISENRDESKFITHFINTLDGDTQQFLEPKQFLLEFGHPQGSFSLKKPEIASLFAGQYRELVLSASKTVNDTIEKSEGAVKSSSNQVGNQTLVANIRTLGKRVIRAEPFLKLNKREAVKVYLENIPLVLDRVRRRDSLAQGKIIRWTGEKVLRRTTIIPHNSTLILEPGTTLRLGKGVSLIVEGALIARGTAEEKILITAIGSKPSYSDYWGSICFIHSLSQDSRMEHVIVEYGSEDHIKGVYCQGALSVYQVPFTIKDCEFRYNRGDDAVNAYYSLITIKDSHFHDNKADALDLDFSNAQVIDCNFYNNGNDGLDCGTSIVFANHNIFSDHKDKGLSIGEESEVKIKNSSFINNNIGVAVKDGSYAFISDNFFIDNKYGVKVYIKKAKYAEPEYNLKGNYTFGNTFDLDDEFLSRKEAERSVYFTKFGDRNQAESFLDNNFN